MIRSGTPTHQPPGHLCRRVYNPSMRPPLLYLPGLDGTGRLLHRQPRLWDEFDVRCARYPDTPPSTYEELADAGARLLGGPGVVLAESFGGGVALELALRRPELVSRLVLVNTFAYFPRRVLIRLAAMLGAWLPAKPSHPMTRGLRGRFFFAPEIPERERTAWWDRTAEVPMSAFGWRIRLIAALDLRARLAEINTPALVVVAPNDRVVPLEAGRLLVAKLPNARTIEMPVGHAAMIHPRIDIAALLADPVYWPPVSVSTTSGAGLSG
jgi:pimeloyl-ACP methyl ester carboxylesterase